MCSEEIKVAHQAFETSQKKNLDDSYQSLSSHNDIYLASYNDLIPFQAWKTYIIQDAFNLDALQFFIEAQNDALASHLLAKQGMWRPSLQSLRSCLENILVALYYADHLVELKLWIDGRHKIGFSELHNYFLSHPDFCSLQDKNISGLEDLKHEYAELSKAVHGSSKSFMMALTGDVPTLWLPDKILLNKWRTRQKKTLLSLNLLLLVYFNSKLKGASHKLVREALAGLIKKSLATKIKVELKINIPQT